jgi:hypothetical protein
LEQPAHVDLEETMNRPEAISFIESVDLSGVPRNLLEGVVEDAGVVFDDAKDQARIVGSGVFSFAKGVDATVREAISDSALLAQLVANKRVSFQSDPIAWFRQYSTVLENIGWVTQDAGFTDYTNSGTAVDVNQHIVEVLSVALGPSPAALAIIKATATALQAMKSDSPWLTLFSRESQKANISRFQIGLVEEKDGADAQIMVSLLACVISAENTITQVLFFKFRDARAAFKASANKASLNPRSLVDLGPAIRAKVRAFQADYVSSIHDL